jgi:uncharacterized protein (DUF2062 family)
VASLSERESQHDLAEAIAQTVIEQPASTPPGIPAQQGIIRRFFWKRLIKPLLDLLRIGTTPQKLAWSLAVGAALGTNPILGTSSLACLAAAFVFRLNVVATQIINHLVFPIQLALIVVFLGAGDRVFHATHHPMTRDAFTHALRAHDWATVQLLWTWEWHGVVVWLAAAVVLTPLAAMALTPVLQALLRSLKNQPTIEK